MSKVFSDHGRSHRVDTRVVYTTNGRRCASQPASLIVRAVLCVVLTGYGMSSVLASEPFSLSGYDASHAVAMISRARILQHWDGKNRPQNVGVETVRAIFVGFDLSAFEGHQERYDVELNGARLDWDHTYIEYDGDMLNLRLLFTYRNQHPVPDAPYRLRYDPQ